MAKSLLDRSEKAELRQIIDASLTELLAMPPAISLASDILDCLHDLNGNCSLCGAEFGHEPHLGDCPVVRHAHLFEVAAALRKKLKRRLLPKQHVMAPLSPTPKMVKAGSKILEACRYGDQVETTVYAVLTAALGTLSPAFSLELELAEEDSP